jgi:ribosomal protein S18 acetylase RimI-like enzyme
MKALEISQVISSEIDIVMVLVKKAILKMEEEGIFQWDEIYPDKAIFLSDIVSNQLYGIKQNGSLAGIMTLNEDQYPAYQDIPWTDNGRALVIHRLCISPDFQGQGLAKRLVQFAEKYARENHYSSIRLDAFTQNKKALGLYDSSHYQRRGVIKFRKGEFYCYEKVL